jgi:hypothetical protein
LFCLRNNCNIPVRDQNEETKFERSGETKRKQLNKSEGSKKSRRAARKEACRKLLKNCKKKSFQP